MATIDANTKGGTLESGTSYKQPLNTDPKSVGMDKGNGEGQQKVPQKPSIKAGNGTTIK